MKNIRKDETAIYIVCWLIAVAVYMLDNIRTRASLGNDLFDSMLVIRALSLFLPYLILFSINNWILIPQLLRNNRIKQYLLYCALALSLFWVFQYFDFMNHQSHMPRPKVYDPEIHVREFHLRPPHPHGPAFPMPLLLDFTYGLLVIGCNLAVALLFQRYEDKFEKESLLKATAENELASLKAQINPHFYMNMLNNIHGMIEIDPMKAQQMVIDMSGLMRYMLYESSKPMVYLLDEMSFIKRYIDLMRIRYPENKVSLSLSLPEAHTTNGIKIPPLLYLVFIENAFKHGISFIHKSYVEIVMNMADDKLNFVCINSFHESSKRDKDASGIGLANIRQRISLIYGEKAMLSASRVKDQYIVTLSIPLNETENSNN